MLLVSVKYSEVSHVSLHSPLLSTYPGLHSVHTVVSVGQFLQLVSPHVLDVPNNLYSILLTRRVLIAGVVGEGGVSGGESVAVPAARARVGSVCP